MSTAKFNTWQNAGGTEEYYKCRAWVNFNGTGTVAIRASGNVSSITDNGTGDYTVNFTTALPDANYAVCGTCNNPGTANYYLSAPVGSTANQTTTSVRVASAQNATTAADAPVVCVAIFR